jgi:hypothetical protein
MVRPRIYLSGPISDGGTAPIWEQKEHVRFATEFAFELIRQGFSVLCPHWSLLGEELIHRKISHADWIANDLPWIETCDALYLLPGESKGADAEVEFAQNIDKPVFREQLGMRCYFTGNGMLP